MQRSIQGFVTYGSGLPVYLSLEGGEVSKESWGTANLKAGKHEKCPGRPAQISKKMCDKLVRMSDVGEFLDSQARTPESLVEGRNGEPWQEKGELNWVGMKTQDTWVQRSRPYLVSDPHKQKATQRSTLRNGCLQQTCKQKSGRLIVVTATGQGSQCHREGREARGSVALQWCAELREVGTGSENKGTS